MTSAQLVSNVPKGCIYTCAKQQLLLRSPDTAQVFSQLLHSGNELLRSSSLLLCSRVSVTVCACQHCVAIATSYGDVPHRYNNIASRVRCAQRLAEGL